MLHVPDGLQETNLKSKKSSSFHNISSIFKQNNNSNNSILSIEDWWYKEVIWWRRFSCFIWFFFCFIFFYCFILYPFDLLDLSSSILLFLCSELVLFMQQTLRSLHRGYKLNYTSLQIWGSILCLFFGCFLSILSIFSFNKYLSLDIFSQCYATHTDKGERVLYCLNEHSLCLLLFTLYLSLFVIIRFLYLEQNVLGYPSIQQGKWFRMKSRIPLITQESIYISCIIVGSFYSFYFIWSSFITSLIVSFLSNFVTNIYVFPKLWDSSFFSFPFLGQIIYTSLIFIFIFHWCRHLTDIFLTQYKRFDNKTNKKGLYKISGLLDGISSSDSHVQFAALMDLSILSKYDYSRRNAIYSNYNAWEIIFNNTCKIINNFTIRLQNQSESHLLQQSKLKNSKQSIFISSNNSIDKRTLFGDTQAIIWATQSLGNLIGFANTEDKQGTVQHQQSISKALNTLLSCLIVLDRFVELELLEIPKGLEDQQLLHPYPYTIATIINSSIYRIVITYLKFISQVKVKLDKTIQTRLDTFINFER